MEIRKRPWIPALLALSLFHGTVIGEEAVQQQAAPVEPVADQSEQAQPTPEPQQQDLFPPDQIEQLVAPVALYPDALLAQVLMASTYPLDIVQAHRWLEDKADLEGEALEQAAGTEPWDASVQSLVFVPDVLGFMNDNLDWTQDLGDAMLGQQNEVMDAVQRLRNKAQDAGTLQTTEQQRVETEGETIVIQPADPQVVYVPTYSASSVYGQTQPPATTYYPATYTTPSTTTYVSDSSSSDGSNLVSFGVGALVGGLLTSAIRWDRNDYGVYYGGRGYYKSPGYWGNPGYWNGGWKRPANINRPVNANRNVNVNRGDVNINRGIVGNEFNKWEHNPERRGGVRYRNKETRQKFSHVKKDRQIDRDRARGRDPDRKRPDLGGRQRPQTRDIKRPEGRPARKPAGRDLKAPKTRQARPAAKRAAKPAAKPAARPSVKKRQSRPAKASAPKRQAKAPANRQGRKPAKHGGGKASAFKKQRGGMDRAASRRGAASRGGGRAARGGGSRHRSGGGGRRSGGGRGGGRRR